MSAIAASGALIFMIFVGLFIVLVPVLTGVYVYKDAKSRNMDATLWTLVAMLVPSFIGLIIYLVVRGNNINLDCPGCKNPVASDYALCPYCGMSLKDSCPSCSAPVDNGWKLCPKCGAALPEQMTAPAVPVSAKKDRKIVWILAVAVIIPIVILFVGIAGMVSFRAINSTQTTSTSFSLSAEDGFVSPEIVNWMERCDKAGKGIYVLQISREKTAEMPGGPADGVLPDEVYNVYIYMNQLAPGTGFMGGSGLNKKTMEVTYNTVSVAEEKLPDYELSNVYIAGSKMKVDKLRILIDGVAVDYAFSELG